MKKVFTVLLCFSLLLSISACERLPLSGKNGQAEDLSSRLADLSSKLEQQSSSEENSVPEGPPDDAGTPEADGQHEYVDCSLPVGPALAQLKDFLINLHIGYRGCCGGREGCYDCACPTEMSDDGQDIMVSLVNYPASVNWSVYPVKQPTEHWNDGTKDPEEWCVLTDSWLEIPAESVHWVAEYIFHVSEKDLRVMEDRMTGENPSYYREGDCYYRALGGEGLPAYDAEVGSFLSDGLTYRLEWHIVSSDIPELHTGYTCTLGLETIGNETYWTLYSLEITSPSGE